MFGYLCYFNKKILVYVQKAFTAGKAYIHLQNCPNIPRFKCPLPNFETRPLYKDLQNYKNLFKSSESLLWSTLDLKLRWLCVFWHVPIKTLNMFDWVTTIYNFWKFNPPREPMPGLCRSVWFSSIWFLFRIENWKSKIHNRDFQCLIPQE